MAHSQIDRATALRPPSSLIDDYHASFIGIEDAINHVGMRYEAYRAVEMLLASTLTGDCEEVGATHTHLPELLRVLNESMAQGIEELHSRCVNAHTVVNRKNTDPEVVQTSQP